MANDPAMLWYWGDWHSGTALLSRFQKGCYMDLLHAQFNFGRLTLQEIQACLGTDFEATWPVLQKKFKKDEAGLYYNARAEFEKIKRARYCSSRRDNKTSEKTPVEPEEEPKEPDIQKKKQALFAKRQEAFMTALIPYVPTYGKDMIRAFYDYWREGNKSKTQMKWEALKTWDLSLRLQRWEKNNYNSNPKEKTDEADAIHEAIKRTIKSA